jgi:L-asparaginase II
VTVPASSARRAATKPERPAARPTRGRIVPPILVRQIRNGIEESVHRGDIVEVDAAGRVIRQLGDPDRVVALRSTVKPFGVLALIEAGGVEAFDLEPAEIAILAASHSGEDLHVRTLQGIYRRTGVSQALLACGSDGMPLDELTAARLARDGEKAGQVRHMCSGQHTVSLLLSRLRGWDPTDYWKPSHPSQIAYRAAVASVFGTPTGSLRTAIDGCGVETYAFALREIARAYAMLADPLAIPATDPRTALAPSLTRVRDAMLANPELIGGRHDRLDTSMMKAAPGRLISKSGMEALRGVAILPGPRIGTQNAEASGMAIKIEDGDGYDRGTWAASVEAVRQVGALDGGALRDLARYHRPVSLDPHGRAAAEAAPEFELVPVGELIG